MIAHFIVKTPGGRRAALIRQNPNRVRVIIHYLDQNDDITQERDILPITDLEILDTVHK